MKNFVLYKSYSPTKRSLSGNSPVEELMRFINFYLDPKIAHQIEMEANEHVRRPESDTSGFISEIRSSVIKTLDEDRARIKQVMKSTVHTYKDEMTKAYACESNKKSSSNLPSAADMKLLAGKNLIERLEIIIPEPKKSNIKGKASDVEADELEQFVHRLKEELDDFVYDREKEITIILNYTLDNFVQDLIILSKQLRLVSKIDVLQERLEEENIPQEIKSDLRGKTEPIKCTLKETKLSLTPQMTGDLNELADYLRKVSREGSNSLKGAVKDFVDTAEFLCDEDSK